MAIQERIQELQNKLKYEYAKGEYEPIDYKEIEKIERELKELAQQQEITNESEEIAIEQPKEKVKIANAKPKLNEKKVTESNPSKLIELGEDISNKDYYKKDGSPIQMPMPSDKEYMSIKGVNMLNYGILTYFSNFQNDNEVEGFYEYDEHRYIYENKIIKDKELIEEYSKTKINTFIRNARKISKLTNTDMITIDTVKGNTVYRLVKGNKFVLIERKILEILIKNCNSNVIKMYMFFKWRVGEKGGIVTRKEIADYIGYCTENCQALVNISQDIETFLVKLGLIRKETIVLPSTEGNEYNRACYYEVVPYDEWIEFWNNKKNAVDFKR